MLMMNRYLLTSIAWTILGIMCVQAQSQFNYWMPVDTVSLKSISAEAVASQQQNYRLDWTQLENVLASAPQAMASGPAVTIAIPNPEGKMEQFEVATTQPMHPSLAARYPSIKTYQGRRVDRPEVRVRFSLTARGFRALVTDHGRDYYVRSYGQNTKNLYQVYWRRDIMETPMGCQATDEMLLDHSLYRPRPGSEATRNGSGDQLITYRMALASDYTFSQELFNNPTVPQVLGALADYVNTLNGVYENEFAIRFELIPNNDQLIFLDAASDPYTDHGNVGALIGQNTGILNSAVGAAAYDIGHVFTGGGGSPGVAFRGSLCTNNKGAGASRSGNVFEHTFAHEVGHQCGTGHIFNLDCSGNRTPDFAYEPASGTTIMSYAGRCFPSIQNQASNYFNNADYQVVFGNTRNGSGTCGVSASTGNQPPTVNGGESGMIIPIQTPFELTAAGSDADGDPLTFCWEQRDLGPEGNPNNPSGNAPIFRSFPPSTNPTRVFPRLSDVLVGSTSFGETYPTYDRDLTFQVSVRDNNPNGGGLAYDQVRLEVTAQAGPFQVISPNQRENLQGGEVLEVAWDPANTQRAPINADSVDIYFSVDGGFTYPYLLKQATPNDGFTRVFLPDTTAARTRIKIKASNNIFFDVSNFNSPLTASAGPGIVSYFEEDEITVCAGDSRSLTLQTSGKGNLSTSVSLRASVVPDGLRVDLPSGNFPFGDPINISVAADPSLAPGIYSFRILLNSPDGFAALETVQIEVLPGEEAVVETIGAEGGDQLVASQPGFTWRSLTGASSYRFQLASSPSFASNALLVDQAGLEDTLFRLNRNLPALAVYYWRVSAVAACGPTEFSLPRAFEVGDCQIYEATDLPKPISFSGTLNSTISVADAGIIADANLVQIKGRHPAFNEIRMTLSKTGGPASLLFDQICSARSADFELSFDDEAPEGEIDCLPEAGLAYQPAEALSVLAGESMAGEYVLSVEDFNANNGGELTHWGLELCATQPSAPLLLRNNPLMIRQFKQEIIDDGLIRFLSSGTDASDMLFTLVTEPAFGSLQFQGTDMQAGDTFTQQDINDAKLTYQQDGTLVEADSFLYTLEVEGRSWYGVETFDVIIEENTRIDQALGSQLSVFPNPTQDRLTIELTELTETAAVTVFNQAGQQIDAIQLKPQGGVGRATLSLGRYAIGLYLVKVQVGNAYYTRQVRVE